MTREQATTARRAWARVLIRRAQDPPRYGSPEWLALDDTDRAKIAAVVAAAECWAQEADDLEDRLRRELVARWHAEKQAEDAEYVAATREHRAQWEHLARAWPTAVQGPTDAASPATVTETHAGDEGCERGMTPGQRGESRIS
jgi:hypothetical protein